MIGLDSMAAFMVGILLAVCVIFLKGTWFGPPGPGARQSLLARSWLGANQTPNPLHDMVDSEDTDSSLVDEAEEGRGRSGGRRYGHGHGPGRDGDGDDSDAPVEVYDDAAALQHLSQQSRRCRHSDSPFSRDWERGEALTGTSGALSPGAHHVLRTLLPFSVGNNFPMANALGGGGGKHGGTGHAHGPEECFGDLEAPRETIVSPANMTARLCPREQRAGVYV